MSEARQSGPSYFVHPDRSEIQVGGWTRKINIDPNPQTYEGYPGLRWRTITYEGIEGENEDGALIELEPGARTPVELVATDTVFLEAPIQGQLTLLSLDPAGNIYVDSFDQSQDQASYAIVMEKGWIFCWFADKDQTDPAQVLETEKPKFKEGDLPIVSYKAAVFNGYPIPEKFWHEFDHLVEENSPITP